MLASLALTGCSSVTQPADLKLSLADPVAVPHPTLPDAVKMHDLRWKLCGADACTSVNSAKLSVKDRLSVARWMSKARNIIHYYEGVTAPGKTNTPSAK